MLEASTGPLLLTSNKITKHELGLPFPLGTFA